MGETTNKQSISSAIDEWLSNLRDKDEFRKKSDSASEKVVEHPHPHNAALTYQKAIQKFLEMIQQKYGVSKDDSVDRLSMDYFIEFPVWIGSYVWKVIDNEEQRLQTSTRRLYGNGVENFRRWLSRKKLIHASAEDLDQLRNVRKEYLKAPTRLPHVSKKGAVQACLNQVSEMPWDDKIKKRNTAILFFMVNSGLRVHEICMLKLEDLQLSDRQGIIIGKGNKQSDFKFTAQDVKRLRDYWQERGWGLDPGDPVFAAHDKSTGKKREKHRHLTTATVYQMIQDVAVAAGVKVWPHAFRHEFVIRSYKKSKDIILTQGLARHANIQTTKDYIDLADDEKDQRYREMFDDEEDGE